VRRWCRWWSCAAAHGEMEWVGSLRLG
jgi:hypothetical protein